LHARFVAATRWCCDEVVLRLDGYLRDNTLRRYGMSLVVAVLDPLTGVVEVAVAGHAPPLHLRGGAAVPVAVTPGMVLGMPFIGGRGYERVELRLDDGDALLLFSDGLFEVPTDAAGTLLGIDGLAALAADVQAGDGGDALAILLDRIEALDVGEQEDDRTGVLVRYHDRGAS
jgi:serine phosphatase RsbU (regulator of sigma subunit)